MTPAKILPDDHSHAQSRVAKGYSYADALKRSTSSARAIGKAADVYKDSDETLGKLGLELTQVQDTFHNLSDSDKMIWTQVTDDISLNNAAGLKDVSVRIWKKHKTMKVITFVWAWVQLGLNTYMAIHNIRLASGWKSDVSTHAGITVRSTGIEICRPQSNLKIGTSNSTGGDFQCMVVGSAEKAMMWQVLLWVEGIAALVVIAPVIIHALHLLIFVKKEAPKVVARHYCLSLIWPSVASRFSLFIFLHLASFSRLSSLFSRREVQCIGAICRRQLTDEVIETANDAKDVFQKSVHMALNPQASITSGCKDDESDDVEGGIATHTPKNASAASEQSWMDWCYICSGVLWICILIAASVHALLMKLTLIYFAGLVLYTDWTFAEYITFFGFINQLSGLSMASEVEMLRLILFKFGGEESKWNAHEIDICDAYFRFLSAIVVTEVGKFHGLALLWLFRADELQRLLLGHMRSKEQDAVREQIMDMYQKLDDKCALQALRDQLLADASSIFRRTDAEVLPDSEGNLGDIEKREKQLYKKWDGLHRKACGQLRLATKVHEFIWQWEKDRLGYDTHGGRGKK